ncbi:MAG: DUF4783 domain-containing protein [Bacteroidota bacterium]
MVRITMCGQKNRKYLNALFLGLGLLLLYPSYGRSQERNDKEVVKIFSQFEEGLSSGTIDKFSSFFAGRNYISLRNGSTGYYSANQSYYVIKDYLSIYQPITFKLTNIVADSSTPFASGVLRYSSKGIRGFAMVFISLQYADNTWRISQITIN